jgi:hypothetical protein
MLGLMRRLPRILLNAATVVSLVLCVATAVLWVRSYRVRDLWSESDGHTIDSVDLHAGWISVARLSVNPPLGDPWPWRHDAQPVQPPQWAGWERALGIGTEDNTGRMGVTAFRHRSWSVAHRLVVAMTAVLPAGWLVRVLRVRRRTSRGRCPACGYDLRVTPARCPECGAVPPPPPPPA